MRWLDNSGNPSEDLIIMGTTESSESLAFADFLRSQRSTTQAEVDRVTYEHDRDDIPAAERFSAVAH